MTGWWQLPAAIIGAGALLLLPGMVTAFAWRLRLLAVVGIGPALGLLQLGVSAGLARALERSWNLLWFLALAVLMSALGLFRWWLPHGPVETWRHWVFSARHHLPVLVAHLIGLLSASLIIGPRIVGRLDAVTGDSSASSVALAIMVVWPLSLMVMVEPLLPMNPVGRVVTAPIAVASVVFPLGLLNVGMDYPVILAMSAAPALLSVAFRALARGTAAVTTRREAMFLLPVLAVGAWLTHPHAVLLTGAVCVPLVFGQAIRGLLGKSRVHPAALARITGVGGLVVFAAMVWAWVWIGSHGKIAQSPIMNSPEDEIALLAGGLTGGPSWFIVLIPLGVVWLLRHLRRRWFWAAGAVLIAGVYLVSALVTSQTVRQVLAGAFEANPQRTGAYGAVFAIPLAIVGAQWLAAGVGRLVAMIGHRVKSAKWQQSEFSARAQWFGLVILSVVISLLFAWSPAFSAQL